MVLSIERLYMSVKVLFCGIGMGRTIVHILENWTVQHISSTKIHIKCVAVKKKD